MRPFLLSGLAVTDWLAMGMPRATNLDTQPVEPMGVMESFMLLGAFALASWGMFRLVVWLDVKIVTRALLREIFDDLGIGVDPGRSGSRRYRQSGG